MRTFLMISPLFPPSRLIGAKRTLTFAKDLEAKALEKLRRPGRAATLRALLVP